MMSSIKINDKTVSITYAGDSSTMTVTAELEYEDIVTYDAVDFTKGQLMMMLEKLELAEPQLTFTAPTSGVYTIQASSFGINAHKIS